jgi:hypothetical protein
VKNSRTIAGNCKLCDQVKPIYKVPDGISIVISFVTEKFMKSIILVLLTIVSTQVFAFQNSKCDQETLSLIEKIDASNPKARDLLVRLTDDYMTQLGTMQKLSTALVEEGKKAKAEAERVVALHKNTDPILAIGPISNATGKALGLSNAAQIVMAQAQTILPCVNKATEKLQEISSKK